MRRPRFFSEQIPSPHDRHGMTRAAFYVTGTPDLFDGEKGVTEYEALAARILLPFDLSQPNPAAAVLDLSLYPLGTDSLRAIGEKIAKLHAMGKNWSPNGNVTRKLNERLANLLKRNPDLNPRTWVRSAVEVLDECVSS